ncbi:MAG: hypothetical protein Fur0024_3800 [Patescibacteria group bacterium]
MTNQENCDLFFSPHCDGSTNPDYRGWMIDGQKSNWTNEQVKFKNLFLKNFTPPIPNSQNHVNANTSYFFGYSYVNSKAKILVEFGAMTNQVDLKFLIENQDFCVEKTFQTILEFFNLTQMPTELDLLKQKILELEMKIENLENQVGLERKAKIFQKFLGRDLSEIEKTQDISLSESDWIARIQGSVEHKKLVFDAINFALGRILSDEEYNQNHKTRSVGNLMFTILKSAEFAKRISASVELEKCKKQLEEITKILTS